MLSPRWKPQTFFSPRSHRPGWTISISVFSTAASPPLEHLFYEFIGDEAKVETSFCHQCSRIVELRTVERKDPAIRLYSSNFLPNKYKAPVYIYIYTNTEGRNLERCRAKWQFALEGFLSMDAHYCVVPSGILNTRSIPIPLLLSSTCRFVSFSFDFSSPYISFVPWIFTRIANLEILFRAFFPYHPIFLIKKERENEEERILFTFFSRFLDHNCYARVVRSDIRKMFIRKHGNHVYR